MTRGGNHGGGIVLRHRNRLKARKSFTRPDITASAVARCDEFAERVANGATLLEAGRAMGLHDKAMYRIWKTIRDGLGWQAS